MATSQDMDFCKATAVLSDPHFSMFLFKKIDVTNKAVTELISKATEYLQPNPGNVTECLKALITPPARLPTRDPPTPRVYLLCQRSALLRDSIL